MGDSDCVIRVSVKWMGKHYENLEMHLNEPLEVFQAQISSLTGVPAERQKLLYKGILLNNTDLSQLKLPHGAKLMLIGTAEQLVERPEKVRFFEDMSPEEKAQLLGTAKVRRIPCGIMNLGNTCYFNAVFNFLLPVHELWESIEKVTMRDDIDKTSDHYIFVKQLLDMRNQLPVTLKRYVPLTQVTMLRRINPLFSRKDEKTGTFMQQDAEECLSLILSTINNVSDEKIVDNAFGYVLSTSIKPKETNDGASNSSTASITRECSNKLNCYMGTQLKSVGSLMDGILLSLNEDVLKFCENAGENIMHEKVGRICSLSKYLVVHLVRFEWKQESEVSKTGAVKAKVCRRVNFERVLDITPICSEELQPLLHAANAAAMHKDFGLDPTKSEGFKGCELYPGEYATGKYELQSIVTHQGRTAEGGHYICWSKDNREDPSSDGKESGDSWLMYDDETVREFSWGGFDLCGGRSDYHIAVLLLYKAQCIRIESKNDESTSGLKATEG